MHDFSRWPRILILIIASAASASFAAGTAPQKPRARDLGVPFDGTPGPLNAITDVAGVTVGHAAEDMTGVDGHRVIALPHAALRAVLEKYNRLEP